MPTINEYNAITGENVSIDLSDEDFDAMVGPITPVKSMREMIEENAQLKASAVAKLAALGLTEDEAKAIIG